MARIAEEWLAIQARFPETLDDPDENDVVMEELWQRQELLTKALVDMRTDQPSEAAALLRVARQHFLAFHGHREGGLLVANVGQELVLAALDNAIAVLDAAAFS